MAKYSKKIVRDICLLFIEGGTIKSVCEVVGISESIYYEWKKDERKPEFLESLKKAEELRKGYGKSLAISAIFKAMPNHWQAGAWWLERNYPGEFRNVQEQKQTLDIEKAREKLSKLLNAKLDSNGGK